MNKFLSNFTEAKSYLVYFLVPMLISLGVGPGLNLLGLVSFYLGYKKRPQKIWPLWLISVVLLWVTYGLAAAIQLIPFEEGGETWWSFGFEAFIFMAMFVAVPMFIGRWLNGFIKK